METDLPSSSFMRRMYYKFFFFCLSGDFQGIYTQCKAALDDIVDVMMIVLAMSEYLM
jgi:hypothetical protein